jgi:pimeloyl-ACP methyl ester carboxylesterase
MDAQPVLCLHAAGTGSREFRPLLHRCPAGFRLILVDWPGHGRSGDLPSENGDSASPLTVESCATILDSFLHQLGIQRPILLGSGFGAAVAVRYNFQSPREGSGTGAKSARRPRIRQPRRRHLSTRKAQSRPPASPHEKLLSGQHCERSGNRRRMASASRGSIAPSYAIHAGCSQRFCGTRLDRPAKSP